VQTKRHASPVPAREPRAVVLRLTASGRRLGVGGAQRDRAAAHGLVWRELAGAGDLVPQLVELPEQLDGVLLERSAVQRAAAPFAALPVLEWLRAPRPPPVLRLLGLVRHRSAAGESKCLQERESVSVKTAAGTRKNGRSRLGTEMVCRWVRRTHRRYLNADAVVECGGERDEEGAKCSSIKGGCRGSVCRTAG
jgi:hypothetical protein